MKKEILKNEYIPMGNGKYYEKWISPVQRLHLIDEGSFVRIHLDTFRRRNNWERWLGKTNIFRRKHIIQHNCPIVKKELKKFNQLIDYENRN